MEKILVIVRRWGKVQHKVFDNVSDAYRYYLEHWVTLGDRLYYWRTAHTRLEAVTEPFLQLAVFHNVLDIRYIGVCEK